MATIKQDTLKKDSTIDKIVAGMALVQKNLIKYKKEKNSPLVISKNNKIVYIMPEDLPDV